ncbi:unnamed protein product [Parascedosporium putredinis]|uniref:protein disulfide-isomerase n=1 Tax=Parascedosporium putredinis TaxID=1442378 RepID=A0A9P1ME24_9PEZI|nr:unnamed protein product [Parascedosporium putredinis]CAI8001800.1 unnamed protein product [Parascedosporium putredinis]
MHYHQILAGLVLAGSAQASLYSKSSAVLQVDSSNYNKLITKSNHTSIVEFYAPWCGHCKNLKPAYEKAAKSLEGLANVAAVNCDAAENKQFCSSLGVQGFPTLKIVKPSKKGKNPIVEDYQGARTASAIVQAVTDKINNHVKRITDADADAFLSADPDTPKAILFTEKGTTSAVIRSIAIDFLGSIVVGQVRNKETKTVEKFNIQSFPSLLLLPGGDQEPILFEGEMKRGPMVDFLAQAAHPNSASDGASKKDAKPPKEKKDKKEKPKPKAEEPVAEKPAAEEPVAEEPSEPEADAETPPAPPAKKEIPHHHLPDLGGAKDEAADALVDSLADIVHRNAKAERKLFPFYTIPSLNPAHAQLAKALEVTGSIEVVAINAKRSWWRRYEGDYSEASIMDWVDAIRMGEGAKNKLPEGIVVEDKHDEL